MRAAKNTWFQNKAKEAQKVRFGGKKVWLCIRDMQRGRRGLVPTRTAMVRDEDGTPCTASTLEETLHFHSEYLQLLLSEGAGEGEAEAHQSKHG